MEKKMTKRQMYEALKAKYNFTDEETKFIDHEIELLDKKAGKGGEKKLTPEQEKNEALKGVILEALDGGVQMTISQMIKEIPALAEIPDCTPQYAMAIVRPMKESGIIGRVEEKGTALFYAVGD